MWTRISVLTIGLLIGLAARANGQSDPMRAQISAATSAAATSLRTDVYSQKITPRLNVGQFLEETDGSEAFADTLQQAQQIGGPRWIDDQTCQVRLELSGGHVARALISLAAVRPKLSPISAGDLETLLADWKGRTFSGTGTSISSSKLSTMRPSASNDAWANVDDAARKQAVAAARDDAARSVLDSIRPIEIAPGQTVGDVLARPPAQQEVANYLAGCPVTQVRFKDDLQVELTLGASPDDLLNVVRSAGRVQDDPHNRARLEREFVRRVSGAIGRATAKDGHTPPPLPIELPAQAPDWVNQELNIDGLAHSAGSPLKTKSAAEANATDALRARIGGLQLNQGKTIDDAIKQDSRFADAVNRALLRTKVYWVEYHPDGSVLVRMMIDPHELWQELHSAVEGN